MVQILAGAASRAFVSVSRHPRSSDSAHVASLFEAALVPATTVGSVAEALRLAVSEAGPEDLVLITGSMFVVAEALEAWYDLPGERYAELDPRHSPVV
jgi:folylpolyglutamate synthase/dihydropteroate synthase